ncbi:universal stress protein [Roseitranquillus sediminis]|uniref:universal stress protein n=1 Tax=Roseitranquillus sediminis TaxID=2809051 RepID=UPI001D0C0E15|nr:universal stress protein [Roseitranquillus sediminis]MBM9594777.1 universal stress protein [Roseitranquillus sediminis]
MYKRIMVPVDLAHADKLDKALDVAARLAADMGGASLVYVGVTAETPSSVAHSPREYAEKLAAFARDQASAHGITTDSHAITAHDAAVELDRLLIGAAKEMGADLIVMASHMPGLAEHIFQSHAGDVASHAPCSVFVVR